MIEQEVYKRLADHGVRPSIQRLAIMEYLMTHHTHPTVEDVYNGLCDNIPTLSKTTVYNTLRMLAEHGAAQMLTIDEHRVCYDGETRPHVHFYCKRCGKVTDLFDEEAPVVAEPRLVDGNLVDEMHLYYKGVCADCINREGENTEINNIIIN